MDEDTELNGTQRMCVDGEIQLIPTPTTSPNDPLNWSAWRRYWHALLVLVFVALTAATANDAGTAGNGMNLELGITWEQINIAAGVLFVGIGYTTLLLSPAPFLYGRRISYLICLVFSVVGSIWMARVQTVQDNIWNQLFVGASESCAEAMAQLSLSDLFFQHQRGLVLGLYVLATSIGTFAGPLIAGFITDSSLGWRWVGWFGAIISGGLIVVFYFTLEETFFDRNNPLRGHATPKSDSVSADPSDKKEKLVASVQASSPDRELDEECGQEKGKTYFQRIALITPSPTLVGTGFKQYIRRLYYTLRVFTFPAVLYSGLQWGAQDAWLTFYLTVEQDNWYEEPWNYSDAAVGIMNVPTLIGSVIGCIYGGWFSDFFVVWMTKRNKGIFEAEQRLWLLLPVAFIGPAGLMLFGIGSGRGWNWPLPYLGLGFIGFGWGCSGDLSMAYLMDAYPDMVLEGMVGVSVINNTIGCLFTFTAEMWLEAQTLAQVFVAIGVLSFCFIMTTVPMIYWGKKCRKMTQKQYKAFLLLRDGPSN
ncbi:Major facilitator superfamily domain general substrate transporter [Penicillium paradoxum]|uniref:Major facilitator superfamily domain general substrate transporter n=1 Tax=Penicillium paradoxum TaxID=176176 RepID=UPI002547917A|nr:Major facilitator superfamily domain general substrate transporter [Penicillium paradoxum]KAJ5793958.1 Major facilitator superfamily domain general substrate transporter [Penicillium paradoxum]